MRTTLEGDAEALAQPLEHGAMDVVGRALRVDDDAALGRALGDGEEALAQPLMERAVHALETRFAAGTTGGPRQSFLYPTIQAEGQIGREVAGAPPVPRLELPPP